VVNAVAMGGVSYADAEDAVQDALVQAWSMPDAGRPIQRLDAWITVVAWNKTRSGLRRVGAERRARARLADMGSSPEHPAQVESAADVWRALAELPRRAREVAVLRYVLQLSTREVALSLGIAEGTVKRALSDARASLARSLRIDDEEVYADGSDR
jgi:RNA polymerase sigma-70 factor, ECF subfamily